MTSRINHRELLNGNSGFQGPVDLCSLLHRQLFSSQIYPFRVSIIGLAIFSFTCWPFLQYLNPESPISATLTKYLVSFQVGKLLRYFSQFSIVSSIPSCTFQLDSINTSFSIHALPENVCNSFSEFFNTEISALYSFCKADFKFKNENLEFYFSTFKRNPERATINLLKLIFFRNF